MEFGLQKADKMESPVLMGNPRKRIEAKAYRARDRMDSGWFRHDAGTPDNSPNVSPAASPLPGTGGRSKQLLGNLCVHCSGDKQQLLKLQQLTMPAGVRSGSLNRGQSPKKLLRQVLLLPACSSRFMQTAVTGTAMNTPLSLATRMRSRRMQTSATHPYQRGDTKMRKVAAADSSHLVQGECVQKQRSTGNVTMTAL